MPCRGCANARWNTTPYEINRRLPLHIDGSGHGQWWCYTGKDFKHADHPTTERGYRDIGRLTETFCKPHEDAMRIHHEGGNSWTGRRLLWSQQCIHQRDGWRLLQTWRGHQLNLRICSRIFNSKFFLPGRWGRRWGIAMVHLCHQGNHFPAVFYDHWMVHRGNHWTRCNIYGRLQLQTQPHVRRPALTDRGPHRFRWREMVPLVGCCREVPVSIGGHQFDHHFFVNSETGKQDVILGRPWLQWYTATLVYSWLGSVEMKVWKLQTD